MSTPRQYLYSARLLHLDGSVEEFRFQADNRIFARDHVNHHASVVGGSVESVTYIRALTAGEVWS